MSDQTPSLDDVRTDYAQLTARHRGSFFGNRDEFDRAIAKIRVDAKVEALTEAAKYFDNRATMLIEGHPVKHEDRRGAYTAEAQHAAHVLARMAHDLEAPHASNS